MFHYDLIENKIKEMKTLIPDKSKPKKKTFWPPALAYHSSWMGNSVQSPNESDASNAKLLFIYGGILQLDDLKVEPPISNQIYAFHLTYGQWFKLF